MKITTKKVEILLEKNAFAFFFLLRLLSEFPKYFQWYNLTESNRIKRLKSLDIKKYKTSDTLFILGSGSSINELGKDEWKIIKNHDSFGINFWLIHEHIPTYYMFEAGKYSDRFNTFTELLKIKADKYENVPFILKHIHIDNDNLDLSKLPKKLRKNLFTGYEFKFPGSLESRLNESIKLTNYFNLHLINNILFFKRASISQALSFAFKMKYKNIVLCGVDLQQY